MECHLPLLRHLLVHLQEGHAQILPVPFVQEAESAELLVARGLRAIVLEVQIYRVRIAGLTAFDSHNNRRVRIQSTGSNNIYSVIAKLFTA
jgi:hypothetical protein